MLDRSTQELLDDVGRLAGRVGAEVQAAPHEAAILTLFDRCRSSFGAIRLLLKAGFAHEAADLSRALFTESLMLADLASADPVRRAELVVGWWREGLADVAGICREGEALGDDVTEDLAAIDKRREQLQRYVAGRGGSWTKWKPDEKKLAAAHNRRREYLDFRITHHFVHGSAMATEQRSSKQDDGTLAIGGPHADVDSWSTPAGLFGGYSLLHATRAVCVVFGWQEPDGIDALLERLDKVRKGSDKAAH